MTVTQKALGPVQRNPVTSSIIALVVAARAFGLPIPEGLELEVAAGVAAVIQIVMSIIRHFQGPTSAYVAIMALGLGASGCAAQGTVGRAVETYGTFIVAKRLATCLTFTSTTPGALAPEYCENDGEIEGIPLDWKLRAIDAAQLASPAADAIFEGLVLYRTIKAGVEAGTSTEEDVAAVEAALADFVIQAEGDIDAFLAVLEEI
jgi:hypothetical protein